MSKKINQDISIGENLQALRRAAHLSQEEVAAKLQIMNLPTSREIISQMETGKHHITVSLLLALSEIYHANIEDFFSGLR